MKEIPLTHGYVALVDDEDYKTVNQHKWHADIRPTRIYARTNVKLSNGKKGPLYMHRLIIGASEVDHREGCGLDNRRSNLRPCSRMQNQWNKQKLFGGSKYKGVCRPKQSKKWQAHMRIGGKCTYLGSFVTEDEAAHAYDAAARKHFGEFARLNFPEVAA